MIHVVLESLRQARFRGAYACERELGSDLLACLRQAVEPRGTVAWEGLTRAARDDADGARVDGMVSWPYTRMPDGSVDAVTTVAIEVKLLAHESASYNRQELCRGVGQCLYYLACGLYCYAILLVVEPVSNAKSVVGARRTGQLMAFLEGCPEFSIVHRYLGD